MYDTRALWEWAKAPRWVREIVGVPTGGGSASGGVGGSGVHVVPPRERAERATGSTSGHRWGSGRALGSS